MLTEPIIFANTLDYPIDNSSISAIQGMAYAFHTTHIEYKGPSKEVQHSVYDYPAQYMCTCILIQFVSCGTIWSHNYLAMYMYNVDRRKMDDAKRTKEIRQLQKERRTKEHKIKLLESDAKRKELVLKRRQEEVSLVCWEYFQGYMYYIRMYIL